MKRITLSFVVALMLIVLGIIVLVAAWRLPLNTPVTAIGGPGTFPVAFLIMIITFSAILAVTELVKSFSAPEPPASEIIGKKDLIKILLLIGTVTVYILNFRAVRFMISTPLLTMVLLWLFGYRNKIIIAVLAIGFATFLQLLFQTFLSVPLP